MELISSSPQLPLVTLPLNFHVFEISRNLYHLHLNPPPLGDGAHEAWIVMFLKLVGTYIIFTSTPLVTELLNCHVFKVSRNLYHLHLNPPWWRSPWIVMFLKLVGTYIIFTSTPLVTELLNCHIFKVSRNLYHLHLNPPPWWRSPWIVMFLK